MAYEREMEVGASVARRAGELALKIREGNIGVEIKADESPVTVADKACEKLIVEELTAAFPDDGLLGEEGASRDSVNGRKWIIDPIDGTRDFIRGTRAWSVLIGLEENGRSGCRACLFSRSQRDVFGGERTRGVLGWRARSGVEYNKKERGAALLQRFELHRRVSVREGSDRLDVGILDRPEHGWMPGRDAAGDGSRGRLDRGKAKPWDLAPLKIIADEAGLVTFDFDGKDTIYGGNYVIACRDWRTR